MRVRRISELLLQRLLRCQIIQFGNRLIINIHPTVIHCLAAAPKRQILLSLLRHILLGDFLLRDLHRLMQLLQRLQYAILLQPAFKRELLLSRAADASTLIMPLHVNRGGAGGLGRRLPLDVDDCVRDGGRVVLALVLRFHWVVVLGGGAAARVYNA